MYYIQYSMVVTEEKLNMIHERVDDIPLLIGLMIKLKWPEIIDTHIGKHGNHKGLSNGWLAYILSEGDHRKSYVRDWVWARRHVIEKLIGQTVREVDFTDDRLGILLKYLSCPETCEAFDKAFWQSMNKVDVIEITGIRVDTTTSYGYHQIKEGGVMQLGVSKDHRPDLPQLKLVSAAAEPTGHLITCDVVPGNRADDPLYLPIINRVREILKRTGLLYAGDCKMAAINTRASLVAKGDYYLMPLPMTGDTAEEMERWISQVTEGDQEIELIWDDKRLFGGGYEFERPQSATIDGNEIQWQERVIVIKSRGLAKQQTEHLKEKLAQAIEALYKLTPPPGRGKRQYRDEDALKTAIDEILKRFGVEGLLQVSWKREEEKIVKFVGKGRGSADRPTRTEVKVRYQITQVERDEKAITMRQYRLGWRAYASNAPKEEYSLNALILHYNGGCCLERGFHLMKDKPLGISPLFVSLDDQIQGLTYLLTLGWRLLTWIEIQVRKRLAQAQEKIYDLYPGQASRATSQPTATRLLTAFCRKEISLSFVQIGDQSHCHVTHLADLHVKILTLLGLSTSIYTQLGERGG